MADADNPAPRRKLPVTAEVGGEGGSYADATVQAETFTSDNPPVDDRAQPSGIPETPPDEPDTESTVEGMRKHPTE